MEACFSLVLSKHIIKTSHWHVSTLQTKPRLSFDNRDCTFLGLGAAAVARGGGPHVGLGGVICLGGRLCLGAGEGFGREVGEGRVVGRQRVFALRLVPILRHGLQGQSCETERKKKRRRLISRRRNSHLTAGVLIH